MNLISKVKWWHFILVVWMAMSLYLLGINPSIGGPLLLIGVVVICTILAVRENSRLKLENQEEERAKLALWEATKASAQRYEGQAFTVLHREFLADRSWRPSLYLVVENPGGHREEWTIARNLVAYEQVKTALPGDRLVPQFFEAKQPDRFGVSDWWWTPLAFLNLKIQPQG